MVAKQEFVFSVVIYFIMKNLFLVFIFIAIFISACTVKYPQYMVNHNVWKKSLPDDKTKIKTLDVLNYADTLFPSDELAQCTNIEFISIYGASSLSVLESGFDFPKLKKLVINTCTLRSFPIGLAELEQLEYLGIVFCDLEVLPEGISKFTHIKVLDFIGNNLKTLPQSIASLENLEEIYLRNNKFTEFPRVLLDIPNLKIVDFLNNESLNTHQQNEIDFTHEVDLLKQLLEKESIEKVLIHAKGEVEKDLILSSINDEALIKKLVISVHI